MTAMALKATIFKASLQISDIDRDYYQEHVLTLARHPSETDERMMVRMLAFARHADEALVFGKGLSDQDEPDLWQKDLTGMIDLWIEVGLPDDKSILKACGRSRQVVVYSYGHAADVWWNQLGNKLERARNLTVIRLPTTSTLELAKLAQRNMALQCTVQDGQMMWTGGDELVQLEPVVLKSEAASK